MNDHEDTFKYEPNDKPMIFPIDYSVREIAKKIGTDRCNYSKNVLQHPFFRSILEQLHWSDTKSDGLAPESKKLRVFH